MRTVGILGSGNIGCDLLVKCQRDGDIEIVAMAGRHADSAGLRFARTRGVYTTDRSIEGIIELKRKPDVLIDCTSAAHHSYNYKMCKKEGIRVIDMTPAKLGIACCPVVNLDEALKADNINMISCGGQASLPICQAIKIANPDISYLEVVSTISSASAGPGTRKNISQYITSTQEAIKSMLHIPVVKTIINITPAIPPIHMKTSVLMRSQEIRCSNETKQTIERMIDLTREYAPGYRLSVELKDLGEKTICQVQMSGSGDYLPPYAGNLDIINCAALAVVAKL